MCRCGTCRQYLFPAFQINSPQLWWPTLPQVGQSPTPPLAGYSPTHPFLPKSLRLFTRQKLPPRSPHVCLGNMWMWVKYLHFPLFLMLCKLFNHFFEIEFGTQSSSIFYIYSILKDAGCTEFVIRLLICLAQCAMHICTLSNSAVLIRNSLEVKSCYNWQNTKPQNEFTNWKQSKNSNGESNDDDDSAATKKHSAVTAVIW